MNGVTPRVLQQQQMLEAPEPGLREPLCETVRRALELYFNELDGHEPPPMYQMVMDEVERPLLETVLQHAAGNQSRAARYLGINRATLRKKLRYFGLLDEPA